MSKVEVEIKTVTGHAKTWTEAVTGAAKQIEEFIDPDGFLLLTKDGKGNPAVVVSADPADTAYLLIRAIETIAEQQNMTAANYMELLKDGMKVLNEDEKPTVH